MTQILLGTYSDAIHQARFDGTLQEDGAAITTAAPSFLAVHPRSGVRYAVAEVALGTVSAFDRAGELIATVPSGGSDPCHLLVSGDDLWVANYGDGTATAIPLDGDGGFAGPGRAFPTTGSGPDADRQSGPHAHSTTAVGDELWVADLGTDRLRRFAGGAELDPIQLPAGCGPRHLAVLPDGAVAVATELDDGLVVVRDGAVVAHVPATAAAAPADAGNHPSHIAVVGELLVIAVRGADVLSTFRLTADGPVHLADSPVGGRCPRHFAAVGEHVLVACQHTDEVTALRLDQGSGQAAQVGALPVAKPACVLPL
ncbi:lactonase family protein [Pseudonocardia sp. CA-107938]|uniref:lactonase family protein n=1 Tax=Pseudonocardia sp. CA-107938 TaxID=3240021 RepID=UPI003D8C84C3